MNFLRWMFSYAAALLSEVSFLPPLLGDAVPPIHYAVLVLGVALQGAPQALWFALIAGIIRDLLAPSQAPSHTLFALATVAVVKGFAVFSRWEEPLREIGAVATGLAAAPVLWALAIGAATLLGGAELTLPRFGDLASRGAILAVIFTLVWFLVFSFIVIRRFRSRRSAELRHVI